MSTIKNQTDLLDKNFENHNFLPQKLALEDLDLGVYEYIKDLNFSLTDQTDKRISVPVLWGNKELWAERKQNWAFNNEERGEEIARPFLTIHRTSVKKGVSPVKSTIPRKRKFTFVKVPIFDGTLKGYDIYKIPQPTYVNTGYELIFETHYIEDVNEFYEVIMRDGFSDFQGYMKINGYDVPAFMSGDPSTENNIDDLTQESIYTVRIPLEVHGKLVDPTDFEKVNTITKIAINICEKKD